MLNNRKPLFPLRFSDICLLYFIPSPGGGADGQNIYSRNVVSSDRDAEVDDTEITNHATKVDEYNDNLFTDERNLQVSKMG